MYRYVIISGLILLYFSPTGKSGFGTGEKDSEKSVVVLPFRNLSNNPENQYLLTESWKKIMVDQTGRPGSSNWTGSDYPGGQGDNNVTGLREFVVVN